MAGTDRTAAGPEQPGFAVILVKPQLGENIGMVARAMLNCGLSDLRLVNPRDGWPNEKAVAAASGANSVIESARVFDDLDPAVADLNLLVATTARSRHMTKPVWTPRHAAGELRAHINECGRAGVIFGPENFGLDNDAVVMADVILNVPLNPAFCSLNLAQAVLLMGYEWFQAADQTPADATPMPKGVQPASAEEKRHLFEHLERELTEAGFLYPPEKVPTMVRNLRNMFQRARLTDQDARTLRGAIVALVKGRKSARRAAQDQKQREQQEQQGQS